VLEDVSAGSLLGTKSEATLGEPSSTGTGEGSAQAAIESAKTSASESESTDLSRLVMVGDSFPAGAQRNSETISMHLCVRRADAGCENWLQYSTVFGEGSIEEGAGRLICHYHEKTQESFLIFLKTSCIVG
jgi:hypothetical protein